MSTLNALPFPVDANGVPYYDNADTSGYLTIPIEQYIRSGGLFVPISSTHPEPTSDATSQATLASILAKIIASPATEAKQTSLEAKIDTIDAVIDSILSKLTTITQAITFHDAATVAADGTISTVGGYKTLLVEIYGTSTSRNVAFIGRGESGIDREILGENLTTLMYSTYTTGTGELWRFNITGLTSIFMDLQAVAGGNVSVKAIAVA